ncbi:MAG: hypothetical protein SF339_13450 [Blastocatellia bacterium]|nr:hypothetical protein [Blastocatellia bacterium]
MITLIKHPKRTRVLVMALILSAAVHVFGIVTVRFAPVVRMAMGLGDLEYVDEAYNRAILIDFSKKKLKYPSGYAGFQAPKKLKSLEEMKKEEARRARLEAARRKREAEEQRRREAEVARQEAEAKARAEQDAKAQQDLARANALPTPTPAAPADGYGRFGKINTAPIKDQIQRLYDAKKAGTLVLPEGKLRVGVEGSIAADGTIASYRITVPSGIEEIDAAARAILDAVSESRALGVLNSLNSLSMVLDIDQNAELLVVGSTDTEQEAADIASLAQAALLVARFKKSGEPAAMIMLNNLKITRTGSRIQAVISVPKQKAQETLANSFEKLVPVQKSTPDQQLELNAVEQ